MLQAFYFCLLCQMLISSYHLVHKNSICWIFILFLVLYTSCTLPNICTNANNILFHYRSECCTARFCYLQRFIPQLLQRLLFKLCGFLPNILKECGMGDMNVKIVFWVFSLAASTQMKMYQEWQHFSLCLPHCASVPWRNDCHHNSTVPLVPKPCVHMLTWIFSLKLISISSVS